MKVKTRPEKSVNGRGLSVTGRPYRSAEEGKGVGCGLRILRFLKAREGKKINMWLVLSSGGTISSVLTKKRQTGGSKTAAGGTGKTSEAGMIKYQGTTRGGIALLGRRE